LQYIEPINREDLILRLQKLASDRSYQALVFFPGFWVLGKWDKEFFEPFAGNLKLVAGSGAGYDHVEIDYLSLIGAYFANSPIAVSECVY
jgi:glyoxylate reductase